MTNATAAPNTSTASPVSTASPAVSSASAAGRPDTIPDTIPLVDLKAQYAAIRPAIDAAIQSVLDSTSFIMGPQVKAFEGAFAAWCGVGHCAGVASGTAALDLVLRGLGVGPGDEVITVAHTFIATAEAISAVGARPVFVDIDPQTYTMDPQALAAAITPRTRAILPVHIYGQPADMDAINAIAARHKLPVVEDAAQAHGATWNGVRAGALGTAACFSFSVAHARRAVSLPRTAAGATPSRYQVHSAKARSAVTHAPSAPDHDAGVRPRAPRPACARGTRRCARPRSERPDRPTRSAACTAP